MRSRAPIFEWCWHLGQTLRFSSSSLSKTIVEHFGHLLQSPSGISFLRDLPEPSFGFLTKPVSAVAGGGVTAGSTVSSPKLFFVNEVVAITASHLLSQQSPC